MRTHKFTLDDFMAQVKQVGKSGPMGKVVGMLPSMRRVAALTKMPQGELERQIRWMQAIVNSMTATERRNPDLLDASRRCRIAEGAGVRQAEVSQFMTQFAMSRQMMQHVGSMGVRGKWKVLMGLVTDNSMDRDPSYAHPLSPALPWWLLALLLGWLALAVLWFAR